MGKQTAKIYYQGKYHSDIITTLGLGTEFQDKKGIFDPANHYQICVKGRVVWERKPANLVAICDKGICVANDLIHLTSMQRNISSLDNTIRGIPYRLNVFSKNFICSLSNSTVNWFLKSKDGFLWEKFYDAEGMNIQSDFIKCRCGGEDCIAAYMPGGKILFFNPEFELIKTVTTAGLYKNMIPKLFGSEKTLYIYGVGYGEDSYGTMEEYVDGELSIRHHFKYMDGMGKNVYLMYNNEEDSVYIRRNSGFCKYKHGDIYEVDASSIYNTDSKRYFYYPWIPDGDAAIVEAYNFDDRLYSYYEFNNSVLHYRHKSQYEMQLRKNGISWFKDGSGVSSFFTKDLFGRDLEDDKCVMAKGIFSGTPNIVDYAYME